MKLDRLNVLLDLDGTLTDSRPGIVACIKHALERLGRPVPEDGDLQRFIGPPLKDTFAHLLCCDIESTHVANAIAAYRDRFTVSGMFENSVYERIPEALAELKARGARLYLATSKPRVFAQRILEHFELADRFEAIYGSELDGSLCDKSELIAHVLNRSNLDARETVMIGDRQHDIAGALANNVFPAGVLWGYGSHDELSQAGARLLLMHPDELPSAI